MTHPVVPRRIRRRSDARRTGFRTCRSPRAPSSWRRGRSASWRDTAHGWAELRFTRSPTLSSRLSALHDLEPLLLPVHSREEREEPALQVVLRELGERRPLVRPHGHRDRARARRRLRPARWRNAWPMSVAPGRGSRCQSTLGFGSARLPVRLKWEIWSWSRRRPLSSDSGGGGQPGT